MHQPTTDFPQLRAGLRQLVAAGQLPGAVAYVQHGDGAEHLEAIGQQGPRDTTPMARDTIFRIYSMTKPVVSLVALVLAEQGRLLLADPVSRWLPAFAKPRVLQADGSLVPALREPTVHDLLRHTAGLSYGWDEGPIADAYRAARIGSRGATNAEFANALGVLPLARQPGSAWEYSRATDVLGALLEAVAGMPLGDLLRRTVFEPLGMRDTGFHVPPADLARLAEPFATDPASGAAVTLNGVREAPAFQSGGGGLVSTAVDYARFTALLRNGGTLDGVRIAGRKTVAWMCADHLGAIPAPGTILPAGYGFGLGVAVRRETGLSARNGSVGTCGWSGLSGTVFFVDPAERLHAVLLVQAPGMLDALCDLFPNWVYAAL